MPNRIRTMHQGDREFVKRVYDSTRRDFLKSVSLGTGGIVFSSIFTWPKETQGQTVKLYLHKVPMDDRWTITTSAFIETQLALRRKMLEAMGQEKMNEAIKQSGFIAGKNDKRHADRFGLIGNDVIAAALIIPTMVSVYYGPLQEYEYIQLTPERAEVRCFECAFWNAQNNLNVSGDLCSQGCIGYWEGFAKAINPKLAVILTKAKPLRDGNCQSVILHRA